LGHQPGDVAEQIDVPRVADLLANDTIPLGTSPTVELLDSPAGGQLDLIDVGLWEYTPGTGFTGSDAFRYRLFDGTDYSLPALVTFEQQPAGPSAPATPAVTDVTEAWLTGFEDEALGSVTVAVFESAAADVLDWTARIDWGDGTTTTGQIEPAGDGRFRVVGEHTYDEWGLYLVQVTLTDTVEATHDLYNLASIQFRTYTYTFTDPIGNSTQFVYATGWRLTQEIDPLGNSTFYSYTSDGLLASRTDRLGRSHHASTTTADGRAAEPDVAGCRRADRGGHALLSATPARACCSAQATASGRTPSVGPTGC
jgi:YD repeat-containing protein